MDERGVRQVVPGHVDVARRDGPAEHALAGLDLERPEHLAIVLAHPSGVVGPADLAGLRIDQVEQRPVGLEQADRDVDRGAEHRGRIVE